MSEPCDSCDIYGAELGHLRFQIEEALKEFDEAIAPLGRCTDGYCLVAGKKTGMHTNGGCHCHKDNTKARQTMLAGRKLRDKIAAIV